jgi:LysM repeat protein
MSEHPEEKAESAARICPTCGTKLSETAERCTVCGADLGGGERGPSARRSQLTLSVPLGVVLLLLVSLLSAGLTYAAMQVMPGEDAATPTATPTITPTQTATPEPTNTGTPLPTPTPLPPIEYTVVENDTCAALAFLYDVSVRSIIELNNLGAECTLTIAQKILIPQPTPTPTPLPTATLMPAEATEAACEKVNYTVQANDTLSAIAENYQVGLQAIKEYNGMTSDTVLEGQVLVIPLCERLSFGPTPTATLPPPWPAPNLLLPQDGAAFTLANDTVTLQWASVGQLREGEFYQVTVLDVTDGTGRRRVVDYVTDTKYIVPDSLRPSGEAPHIMRWWIQPVRRSRTGGSGDARYEPAGAASDKRVFSWSGAVPGATDTP